MPNQRRRPIVVGLAIVVALLVGGVLVFRACAPMTVASWGATSELEAVVGDRATVRAFAVDQSFTSPERCELRVSVREETTVDDLGGLLTDIAPADRYAPCTVTTVELGNRSLLFIEGLPRFSREQWTAIADHLTRGPGVISVGTELSPSVVSPDLSGSDVEGYIASLRASLAGERLEESIGPIRWSSSWKLNGPPYHSVDIESTGTPPAELVAFLEAMVPSLEASDRSIGIHVDGTGTAPLTRVELPEPDAALEADIAAAFAASGMPGELVTDSGDDASSG
ncbi:hypothetical protein KXS11_05800 [Plantibacter flavus]|uniref:hypothetical protein n=1 Tax=Plantibacter flavus TaxID=150123 RepID=UPI003F16A4F1